MAEAKTKKTQVKKALEAPVYTLDGISTGTESLPEAIFGQEANDKLVAQYVRVYLHNQRQGNASTKTRSEVIGSTQKIWRQKGTGRARHGAPKANLFRGGGVTFGPKPKDVTMSMNKKQKKQALFATLSQKASNGSIRIVDAKDFGNKPKTKTVAVLISTMKVEGKVLVVLPKLESSAIVKSMRNIKNIDLVQATTINAYEVLNHKELVFIDDAVNVLATHFEK